MCVWCVSRCVVFLVHIWIRVYGAMFNVGTNSHIGINSLNGSAVVQSYIPLHRFTSATNVQLRRFRVFSTVESAHSGPYCIHYGFPGHMHTPPRTSVRLHMRISHPHTHNIRIRNIRISYVAIFFELPGAQWSDYLNTGWYSTVLVSRSTHFSLRPSQTAQVNPTCAEGEYVTAREVSAYTHVCTCVYVCMYAPHVVMIMDVCKMEVRIR